MASDIAISVEGLSKRYLVGHNNKADPNATLRDQIARNLRGLGRLTRDMARGQQIVQGDTVEEFWALRDVSFEIPRGARVGILGRNGAGKSTLLKLLSRITEPTSGRININGRVASLLEVGTGFHPELSGRENIFLNGAILGMSRREIQSKFDEIVEFAEVERFLDTPVKRYSSGMYVRLAFAVAANLEPEILIIDEVLAVGDAQFQKKCLGKMNDVARSGRTVLFVSHNIASISQLCDLGILLKDGQVAFTGKIESTINRYFAADGSVGNPADLSQARRLAGSGRARFQSVSFEDAVGQYTSQFSVGDDVAIGLKIQTSERGLPAAVAVEIRGSDGLPICNLIDRDSSFSVSNLDGTTSLKVMLRDVRLYPDRYWVRVWCGTRDSIETYDYVEQGLCFDIIDGGALTTRRLPRSSGLLFLTPEWTEFREHALPVGVSANLAAAEEALLNIGHARQ